LGAPEWVPLLLLVAAYAACALVSLIGQLRGKPVSLSVLALSLLATFGLVFFYLLLKKFDSSRAVMGYALCVGLVALLWSQLPGNWSRLGIIFLAAAACVLLAMNLRPPRQVSHRGQPRTQVLVVNSALYNIRAVAYEDYMPAPLVSGGGLSRLDDAFVLATGDGHLYLLQWTADQDPLTVKPLPYRIPINGDEFALDTTGKPWRRPLPGEPVLHGKEDAGDAIITWWFRVAGLRVERQGERVRLFASHYFWKHNEGCWVERVSMLEMDRAQFVLGAGTPSWKTVFDTQPCLPIAGEGRRRGTAFAGHFGGGRLLLLDSDTLLLTVGDFGFNGVASARMLAQDPSTSYGKAVLIHIGTGQSEIYSSGLRNPQGLYRAPDGRIWETEQGPQGGDELNILKHGSNYGWPLMTYGTDYGALTWPLNPTGVEFPGFELPIFSWLPDIGVNDLIGVEQDLFPLWRGDLLVGSLAGQTLFRLRVRDDRVEYVEPIKINNTRIRDVAEAPDGRLVLWEDDDNTLVSLRPLTGSSGEALFATNCSGCHKVGDGSSHRIGPDLYGVVGRPVASAVGYVDYSPALRASGGRWSEERINRFIQKPQTAVPGTAMEFPGLPDADSRTLIIDYLKHAPKVVLQ
jgi:cytochrome c2